MARTILITIDDNKVAAQFARDLATTDRDGYPFVPRGAKLDAVVARPTLACQCSPTRLRGGRHGGKILMNFKVYDPFGWFVCAICGRPTKAVVDNFISNRIVGLRDLLPKIIPGRTPANKHARETEDVIRKQEAAA